MSSSTCLYNSSPLIMPLVHDCLISGHSSSYLPGPPPPTTPYPFYEPGATFGGPELGSIPTFDPYNSPFLEFPAAALIPFDPSDLETIGMAYQNPLPNLYILNIQQPVQQPKSLPVASAPTTHSQASSSKAGTKRPECPVCLGSHSRPVRYRECLNKAIEFYPFECGGACGEPGWYVVSLAWQYY